MIIFSRKTPWLLGTTILGTPPYVDSRYHGTFLCYGERHVEDSATARLPRVSSLMGLLMTHPECPELHRYKNTVIWFCVLVTATANLLDFWTCFTRFNKHHCFSTHFTESSHAKLHFRPATPDQRQRTQGGSIFWSMYITSLKRVLPSPKKFPHQVVRQ